MAATAFHIMAKPTGAICNLDCDYCFFLSKEQLYPGSGFRMEPHVHEAYLDQLLAAHADADEVVVAFQGGEPTMMGLEFFRRTIELEEKLRRPGQRVLNTLQTNGTLLDGEWGEFLREHGFLVGLSVDGPRAMHDYYRVDKGGRPTFDRVMRGLDVLREHHVDWNALTTVNAANGDHGREVYTFLRDQLGARFVQFIPVVEREAAPDVAGPRSVGARQYGQFLVEAFEEWVRHDVGNVFVQVFDTALAHWLGMDQVGMCVHARTCGTALALEHNGDVYSCDHYVERQHLLGNIAQGRTLLELVTSPRQRAFGQAKADSLPDYCRRCDVRFACNGGCPKDRFLTTPDGEPGLHYLCAGYQRFFRHIDEPMRVMADLLRRGEEPSAVRDRYAAADAARSWNDPCTCGSANTWRRCHGGKPERKETV
ncbi:anaerobic sulfatase-maturating enzyme [Saccharomonospora marina XMU15]|uniref:Anaerobic sulfatase-maturating enzyme n=1 Tax=Saccharomonospora marina XMU15 TaxID=882083 RepID=H5X7N5_9PSEU|nr:anaerobic sulfatase maturase [Saccharomonospora marina]EHR51327.1 anaerobic sulfatase-maturating enzyme [Saccharomonospora marina XMU15]